MGEEYLVTVETEGIREEDNRKHYTPQNLTVKEWYSIWIAMKERTVSDNSLRNYKTRYRVDIDPLLGSMPLQEVKPIHCQAVLNTMADKGRKTGTIKDTKVTMSNLFEYAVENELLLKNPCKGKSLKTDIGVSSSPRQAMTIYQQKKFVKALDGNVYRNQFLFVLQTGLRCGELCGLQWDDIDLNQKMMYINRTMEYHSDIGWRVGNPKTKTSRRSIPLTKEAINILKDQKNKMNGITFSSDDDTWKDYVFLDGSGNPITSFCYDNMLSIICKEINIPHISMHILRHTFATRCIEAGMKPKTLQTILGHSNLSTTMDLYVHTTEDEKLREINKVSSALNIT